MLCNPRGTEERARRRVTLKMYYSYYLLVRDYFNPLLSAGPLTQQYIVDAYVKAEANDLNYIRMHQKELRCGSYANVLSHHLEEGNRNEPNSRTDTVVGNKIKIIPSRVGNNMTFALSPRSRVPVVQDRARVPGLQSQCISYCPFV
jgi:hypothetical protein